MATDDLPRTGEWVRYLQDLLQRTGYWSEERSEVYHPTLQEAVRSFQHDHNLEADGVLRGATWVALVRATDTEPHNIKIDWAKDYPEIYRLATVTDFDDYLRRVVEIDLAIFEGDSE